MRSSFFVCIYMSDKKSIKNWAKDDRPREKLICHGPQALSSAELLAILIGSGIGNKSAVDLAREILNGCDNKIDFLCKCSYSDLLKYEGIGEAKAVSIVAALELSRRRENAAQLQIHSSRDIFEMLVGRMQDVSHEVSYAIYLTQSHGIIKIDNVSKGGIDQTVIDVRIVMGEALRLNACAIVLAHNHPSGNITPSRLDDNLTQTFCDACKILNVRFVDHLIIAGNGLGYYSYRDSGRII